MTHIKDLTSQTHNYINQDYVIQYLSSHSLSVDFAAVSLTYLTAVKRQPCSLQRANVITKLLRNEITNRRSLRSCLLSISLLSTWNSLALKITAVGKSALVISMDKFFTVNVHLFIYLFVLNLMASSIHQTGYHQMVA